MSITIYKIRRKSDGLFSMGGDSPKFNKNGKVWKQIGHLKNHLAIIKQYLNSSSQHIANDMIQKYKNCEIVEYEIVERNAYPVNDMLNERKKTWNAERKIQQQHYIEHRKKELEHQLQNINNELKNL